MILDLDKLEALAKDVPNHIVNNGFTLANNPVFGDWYLYSDNGRGQGRQYIASFPSGENYFGSLAQFMAACDPKTILALIRLVKSR